MYARTMGSSLCPNPVDVLSNLVVQCDVSPVWTVAHEDMSACSFEFITGIVAAVFLAAFPGHVKDQTLPPGHARHLVAQSTHRLDRIGLQCLEATLKPREERDHDLAQRVAQRLAQPVEARQHAVGRNRRGGRLGGGDTVA